jgi:hypothetical protein
VDPTTWPWFYVSLQTIGERAVSEATYEPASSAFHHAIQIYFLTHSPSQSDGRKPLAAEDVLFQVDQVAINLPEIEARRRSVKARYCLINKLPQSCGLASLHLASQL